MSLSAAAKLWIASGERCPSSETLFTFTTGIDCEGDHGHNAPQDCADFRRCRLLLEQCPELEKSIPRVSLAGPVWTDFVHLWRELSELQDHFDPDWRDGCNPELSELLNESIRNFATRN